MTIHKLISRIEGDRSVFFISSNYAVDNFNNKNAIILKKIDDAQELAHYLSLEDALISSMASLE